MLNVVIFDFDGVLVDTFEIAYRISSQLNKGLSKEEYKEFFDGNVYDHKKVSAEVSNKFYIEQEKMFCGLVVERYIIDALLQLKKKYKLYIITSNREDTLADIFKKNSMQGIFEKVLGLETHKSKEKKFAMVFEKYPQDECVFITDTVGDIKEAHNVGIRTIAVDYGFHERERLEKAKPFKLVSSFTELLVAIDDI